MKLINPSFRIIEQEPEIEGAWKMVEKAARVCYQSEQRNTDETSEQFCKRVLLKHEDKSKNHLRPLEFGTVYLQIPHYASFEYTIKLIKRNHWSKAVRVSDPEYFVDYWHITTNLRVLYEHDLMRLLEFWCEPTKFHYKRVTIDWVIGRDIADEFRTHVSLSSTMESSRYCNYSKGKFDGEVTFVIPNGVSIEEGSYNGLIISTEEDQTIYEWIREDPEKLLQVDRTANRFIESMYNSEAAYLDLLNRGWKPEMARKVLAFNFKAEMMQCGFITDWERFFALRSEGVSGTPHPDAKYIADQAYNEFKKYAN